ncbi:hypothetical protein N7468_002379 [Penicillium chermesinum]|uniref:BTB domain-containing protein n=1 Tax=Penicillium chermesinum TaxID=63820 RepID=A0A9W9PIE7_9EURO|nr:uncharacterized protein N7468_002379 [Penicillium chermesinum]KAJ5247396.1 hypothetical protein N7468_002379 [Penicillium chermesinum]
MPSQISTYHESPPTDPPIKITVGKGSTYYVHPGAFAPYTSSALHAQIHGSWKDTFAKTLDWSDFDEQTIECVLQFLYTGDYDTLRAASEPNGEQQTTFQLNSKKGGSEAKPRSWSATLTDAPASTVRPPAKKTTPSPNEAIDGPVSALKNGLKTRLESSQSEEPHASEATVAEIAAHAKVYAFAHRFLFSELEEHALHRLSQGLVSIQNKKVSFYPHIAEAIDIIYAETPSFSNNPARKLMTQFVAMGYTSLEGEDLDILIEEDSDFAVDLSHALARALYQENPLQDKVTAMERQMREMEAKMKALTAEVNGWEKWDSRLPLNERRWPASYY